jgi:hypothetical protein
LALLLQSAVDEALAVVQDAVNSYGAPWHFDSERVGAYELLRQARFEGIDTYEIEALKKTGGSVARDAAGSD